MKEDKLLRVETAAYALMAQKGFHATSMLAIAREAKVSNQTLYKWFDDKTGLFEALVMRNGQVVRDTIHAAISTDIPALYALSTVSTVLLEMLLGPRAITLNKAAAADPTHVLGQALAKQGRETISPLIQDLLRKAQSENALQDGPIEPILSTYFALLIADTQIRQVTGAVPPLTKSEQNARVQFAQDGLIRLYGTE